MIPKDSIDQIVSKYDRKNIRVGCIGSHSALDVCDGASEEKLENLVVCQRGRERTYSVYFRSSSGKSGAKERGIVDECLILDKYAQVMEQSIQRTLVEKNVVFVPNRSFTSYVDIQEIEEKFAVPLFGNRMLLRSEERGVERDYYWLLDKAKLPFPNRIKSPKEISNLSIIKLHHAKKKLERGFFSAASYGEYLEKAKLLINQGVIDRDDLAKARIERYIIGPVFNLDFFWSPLAPPDERLELLGVDWRFESSLDGYVRLPAQQQLTLAHEQAVPEYTVCGHNVATLRESLLETAFDLAEKYVKATQEHYPPGIVGPFCLQTCVDKDLKFWIYDVAPRIGGGTNAHIFWGHPYGNALWQTRMSTGRRIAREIRKAIDEDRLKEIVT